MNVLFQSPLGGLLARPWIDPVGLFGLRRWYMPLSRLWAAANEAGEDVPLFREQVGGSLAGLWSALPLDGLLRSHARVRDAARAARDTWENAVFGGADATAPAASDRQRRSAATRHLLTRGWFYPLLFPRKPASVRWQIDPPAATPELDPVSVYGAPVDPGSIEVSSAFVQEGLREYWLRAPTPSPRLGRYRGSEHLYARVVEPANRPARDSLIFGSGLCLELDLLAAGRDAARGLADRGWRVIEPVSPYHGLRAMPGFYGGEPFFALAPAGALDLITGQTLEFAVLTAWARRRFGGKVAVAGISMTSFVAQQVASRCALWPSDARPDGVLLISHSGRIEDVTFGGALARTLGIEDALRAAGWSRDALARVSHIVDPSPVPAIDPARIVSVLGMTDRWVPYDDGLAVAERWSLPSDNIFRYPLGHLGMPVQLARDPAPVERLRRVLAEA